MGALVLISPGSVQALTNYNFETIGLNDLNHNLAYKWGINTPWGSYQSIISATLTFHDIFDWMIEDDTLYVNLLDNGPVGVTAYGDYNPAIPFNDYFGGQGYFLGTWSDPDGPASDDDVSFDVDATALYNYSLDHNIAFGIDPDCHYYASRVTFDVTTTDPIPEPGTLILVGLGLAGVGLIRRRK